MIEKLKNFIGFLTFSVVVAAFVYFAVVTAQQNVVLAHQAQASERAERALCILRDDLSQQAESARQFLEEHPEGIPGISPAAIQQSIDNKTRTVLALSLLQCPTP